MNPIMRRKHLEMQSNWPAKPLSTAWQNSVLRELHPIPFKRGNDATSYGMAGSCLESIMVEGLTFLLPELSREKTLTHSWTLTWSQTPRQGPLGFFCFQFLPLGKVQDIVLGSWHIACGLCSKWRWGMAWSYLAWHKDQSLPAYNGSWKTAFVYQFFPLIC